MSRRTKSSPIRFGTDGWRALIANEFTFENVERVAQAYADYLNREAQASGGDAESVEASARPPRVIVGYDRRFLSPQFAARAAEVLAGNNLKLSMFDSDVPTPLVSWAVREMEAAGGVVITASHNPPSFNGFKIKAAWGGSATAETTVAVESLVDASEVQLGDVPANASSGLERVEESYRRQVASLIDLDRIRRMKARVIIDPMHGAGGRWVESFLQGATLETETIRSERDTLFGGVDPEPIDRNLAPLKNRVRETGALLGLATDGDADRLGAVNQSGATMTMHEVVPLILLHLARRRGMRGGVVRTFSQSVLLKRIAEACGLALYETPIGFKYVADLMLKEEVLLGAEESGGIGVRGHLPERDGILNSLILLEAVASAGTTPGEMVEAMHREFGEFHFGRRDLHIDVARGLALVESLASKPPASVAAHEVASVQTLDGTKLTFEDESWLLFRQSGTEPLLRIYAEATSKPKTETLLEAGEALARTDPA